MDLVIVLHTMTFLAFWLTNLDFQQEVNDFLLDLIGLHINYLLIFILFTAFVGLWSIIRLGMRKNGRSVGSHLSFHMTGGLYLIFFYGSFTMLLLKNPVQVIRLGQLVMYFRLFLDSALLLLAAWGLRIWLRRQTKPRVKWLGIGLLAILWLIPVFWSPGSVLRGELPKKPLLIAHRGASMLAPENTLTAMRTAANLGVYGLETDITISRDGVLFLMHDTTLERTTNIAHVFPGREKEPADSFSWNELVQLDAGLWFTGLDRFGVEPIPTLTEVLQVVQENNLHFIYDLHIPLVNHPFISQTLDLCLLAVNRSGVENRTWVLTSAEDISKVQAMLPQSILSAGIDYAASPSPQELVGIGYQLVNSEFGLSNRMIHAYQHAGLWVNLWTVDEPWQYSRLWMAGADSVTSNNIQALITLSNPVMMLMYWSYLVIWGIVGILAAVLARC